MATAKKPSKDSSAQGRDYEQLGRMLANIYDSGYIDRNQMYKMSFLKGLVGGLGGVIGATIVVALLIWLLSLFNDVPLIGRLVDNLQNTIESSKIR